MLESEIPRDARVGKEVESVLRSLVGSLQGPLQERTADWGPSPVRTADEVHQKLDLGWSTGEILRRYLQLRPGVSEEAARKIIWRGLDNLKKREVVDEVRKGLRGRGGRYQYAGGFYWLRLNEPLIRGVAKKVSQEQTQVHPYQLPDLVRPVGKGRGVCVSLIMEKTKRPVTLGEDKSGRAVARARKAISKFIEKHPTESIAFLETAVCEVLSRIRVDSFLLAYPERRDMVWPCRDSPYDHRAGRNRTRGARRRKHR